MDMTCRLYFMVAMRVNSAVVRPSLDLLFSTSFKRTTVGNEPISSLVVQDDIFFLLLTLNSVSYDNIDFLRFVVAQLRTES